MKKIYAGPELAAVIFENVHPPDYPESEIQIVIDALSEEAAAAWRLLTQGHERGIEYPDADRITIRATYLDFLVRELTAGPPA